MQSFFPDLMIIVAITAIALSVYYTKKTRHIERMTLIEKGYSDISILKKEPFAWRRLGFILAGFGIGAIVSQLLFIFTPINNLALLTFGSFGIFIGLGLILSHYFDSLDERRSPKPNPEQDEFQALDPGEKLNEKQKDDTVAAQPSEDKPAE